MTYRHITLFTLAACAFGLWATMRKDHLHRRAARVRSKPEELQTWEGEGGGLPAVKPHDHAAARDGADATP